MSNQYWNLYFNVEKTQHYPRYLESISYQWYGIHDIAAAIETIKKYGMPAHVSVDGSPASICLLEYMAQEYSDRLPPFYSVHNSPRRTDVEKLMTNWRFAAENPNNSQYF